MEQTEKDTACPKCKKSMTYQGSRSVGVGMARKTDVPVYLCPACGCNGWYDEKVLTIREIQ